MQTTPNNSRALAIISYITFIGWIIAFMLNNKQKHALVTYHQKQSLGIQGIYFAIAVLVKIAGLFSLQVLFLGVFILIIIGIKTPLYAISLNSDIETLASQITFSIQS